MATKTSPNVSRQFLKPSYLPQPLKAFPLKPAAPGSLKALQTRWVVSIFTSQHSSSMVLRLSFAASMQHLAFSEQAEMGEEPRLLKWQEELFGKGFLKETVRTNKSHLCVLNTCQSSNTQSPVPSIQHQVPNVTLPRINPKLSSSQQSQRLLQSLS